LLGIGDSKNRFGKSKTAVFSIVFLAHFLIGLKYLSGSFS
jgi:hypothetical protein